MKNILKEVKEELKNYKVVVACSTGVDSMTLLTLVMQVCKHDNIVVAHVNHKKRLQSDQEEIYIKTFCEENNLKYYIKHLDHIDTGNFQSLAREKRYEFFDEVVKSENAKYLLLAHHADDNIETILMRLLKSSSLKGYAGIEKKTYYHNYYIYRPFLDIPKLRIQEYANNTNIKYYEDDSNQTLDYTRNRIRHLIVPILLEENPNLYEAVSYYSKTLLSANNIIENNEISFIENKIVTNNINGEISHTINIDDLLSLDDFMQKQILFRLLRKYNLSHKCIEEIIKKIKSQKSSIVSEITPKLALIKEHKRIIFTEASIKPLNFNITINGEGIYDLPNGRKIEISKNNCNFFTTNDVLCYNIQDLPIIIRTRVVKDKIKNTLVSDYLTKLKLPYMIKKDILLLCDCKNNVIAVLGHKGGKKWQM
ncbi:MAG: tRNA lysidine(34) synthetase TilS [Bacilli bacterium]